MQKLTTSTWTYIEKETHTQAHRHGGRHPWGHRGGPRWTQRDP